MSTQTLLRYFNAIHFFGADSFIMGIYILFLHDSMGYSFAQATSIYALFWFSTIILDLIAGGLSDAIGNRRSHIIGEIVSLSTLGLGVIYIHDYRLLLVMAAIAGMGQALKSGSLAAYLADRTQHQPQIIKKANAHGIAWTFSARASTTLIGAGLYVVTPLLPFLCYYLFRLIALTLVWHLPPDHRPQHRYSLVRLGAESLHNTRQAIRYVTVTRGAVLMPYLLGVATISYLGGDLFFSSYQAIFTKLGLTPFYIGATVAGISAGSALGAWAAYKLKLPLIIASGPVAVTVAGIAVMTQQIYWALIGVLVLGIASGMVLTTQQTIISLLTPPGKRAAALSVGSTTTHLGSVVAFLLGGIFSDQTNALELIGMTAIAAAGCGTAIYCSNRTWLKKLHATHRDSELASGPLAHEIT